MMEATAVIPVFNRRDLLARLLDGLCAQTRAASEVIVVDNGSRDGAADLAESRGARVIRMGANTGFATAVNRGIRECRTPLVAVLNSDVELDPGWLETLSAAFAEPRTWFAVGKILDAAHRERLDGAWDVISRAGCPWRAGHARPDAPPFDAPRAIHLAPWTAAVFRAGLFERVGLLDERFESYLEDVDFGLRCVRLDLAGAYVPAATAWHHGSATLGRWHPDSVRRMARNQVFLLAKHYPGALLARWAWPALVGQSVWGFTALRHGAGFAYVRGKLEGLRRFPEMRRDAARDPEGARRLARFIAASESEILNLQRATRFDPYWRFYFLLAAGEAS